MHNKTAYWQIWIDTGGTFTDCMAISPKGKRKHLKVLSSSCLRGRVTQKLSPEQWAFSHKWPLDKDIFKGYHFRKLSKTDAQAKIIAIDFKNNTLTLDKPIDALAPFDFEITGNEEAPILASRIMTQTALDDPLPPIQMKLGSTKGTNAILEKKGVKVTLLTTEGFEDLPEIGTQQRPNLFQLHIPPKNPIYNQVIGVPERIDAKGQVLKQLHHNDLKALLTEVENEVVVVALMNSYLNPIHEIQIKEALLRQGFQYISLSHELSPTIKILPRTQTALVNGYLSPIIAGYTEKIQEKLNRANSKGQQDLMVMTSTGGLAKASSYHPKDGLLGGPAGGVIGAVYVAKQLGVDKILTLDMGGTSTDTALYDGKLNYKFTTEVGDITMNSPALAIETVAAGGGSICYFDGTKLCVGPESAKAYPGPACYGAGGPLTITDVNLLLGKMNPQLMGIPIDHQAAEKALVLVIEQVRMVYPEDYSSFDLLAGF